MDRKRFTLETLRGNCKGLLPAGHAIINKEIPALLSDGMIKHARRSSGYALTTKGKDYLKK